MGPSGQTWSRLPPFCVAKGTHDWPRLGKITLVAKGSKGSLEPKFGQKAHARHWRAQLCSQLHLLPCSSSLQWSHFDTVTMLQPCSTTSPPPPGSESCVLQALAPAPVPECAEISEGTKTSIISQVPLHPPCLFGYTNHVRHAMQKGETNTMTCGKRLRFPQVLIQRPRTECVGTLSHRLWWPATISHSKCKIKGMMTMEFLWLL